MAFETIVRMNCRDIKKLQKDVAKLMADLAELKKQPTKVAKDRGGK